MFTALLDKIQGKPGKRSPEWAFIRDVYLAHHPACEACGGVKRLRVHHIRPFHLYPALELDIFNLITLCESGKKGINCHLALGHSGNFRAENTNVRVDVFWWRGRSREFEWKR